MAKGRPSLSDRLDLSRHRVILNGSQAIVRLMLTQKMRDEEAGLDTGGFATGYRGSPVGALDMHFQRAEHLLKPRDILFQPGINEELAATAVWGAQQVAIRGEGDKDGVFCIWYGKGPGVDRCGDVFRHANSAGSAECGGVLVLMGDDHGAESSTVPHQSEFTLIDAMMPILNPAGVQEILDYGVLGFALSRYSGCWVGLKCIHENIESTATVDADPHRVRVHLPEDFEMPEGGLNIRAGEDRFTLERRLHLLKPEAARAFARTNGIDRIVWDGGPEARIGIVSTGKSWMDTLQALADLGIDEARARELGIRLLKIGMVWPLEPQVAERFAKGLETVIVVEEKRGIIEPQLRELLYGRPGAPCIIGKRDERGEALFPAHGVLDPLMIARAVGARLPQDGRLSEALKRLERIAGNPVLDLPGDYVRVPWFCAGCPHNTSTRLPEGARGYAGIGCHWLVQLMPDRRTEGFTQMGCEGANWIGEAPFSKRRHVFQNMGDGTYAHSGLMAIRACRAAGVNITFKILYNDAVAMTGGQGIDGGITVPDIAWQARAEGVERIAVVAREPHRWSGQAFPPGTTFHDREELEAVQEEMRTVLGVSMLIYDQTCAAELRRRRKRGLIAEPERLVHINEAVCEGCGDCADVSNCVAIVPVETPWGRKRQIDQSVCNRDYLCLEGFCPAMVTVEGAQIRKGTGAGNPPSVPEPEIRKPQRPFSMAVAGIGGTGVVTVGQILAQAAQLEGMGAGIIDQSGISQKNGAVLSHLKIARRPEDITAIRTAPGGADLLLGCDLLTAASKRILRLCDPQATVAVVNDHAIMPAQFTHDPDLVFSAGDMRARIEAATASVTFRDASELASALLGDSIFANMLLTGMAWQTGLVPVPRAAILEAIRLNGVAVEENIAAFDWGRAAAHDPEGVLRVAGLRPAEVQEETLEEIVERGVRLIRDWGDAAAAEDYRVFVEQVRQVEEERCGCDGLARVVARQLARLVAYKDEYEVARLHANAAFRETIRRNYGEDARVRLHMTPPLLARRDPVTGRPRKRAFGRWMTALMPLLARMRFLRGTPFDPFGYTEERRMEQALPGEYRALVERLLADLGPETHGKAVETVRLAERIRGFGHVKQQAVKAFREKVSGGAAG